ncbi:glycosyltransferase family 4 protein [Pseudomonas sp.]|uniref:glycosyltransferase family 4 protein n=1 Tax=Pseudomonas sp. TaxID=306 RepID=UPI00272A7B3B|nr:glycosyltransferase family 4 protein [Pseudomonas sp.]
MSSTRPTALLITPILPEPGGSGRALRAWDWLCTLAKEYDVQVLVTADFDADAIPEGYPAAAVWPLHGQVRPSPRWGRAAGLLCPVLGLLSPSFMLDWLHPVQSQGAAPALAEALAGRAVERIVVFRLVLHPVALSALRSWPEAVAELDLDDLESAPRLSVAGALWRMGRRAEALRTALMGLQYRVVERWLGGAYATLWLAAPDDARALRTRLARSVAWRPNRFPALPQLAPRAAGEQVRLLFVGSLDYPPNEESVRFLLGLASKLDAAELAWRLTIVGRRPPEPLKRLVSRCSGVELLDGSDDLAGCYGSADLVLVPVFAGGGTKLKTLEALAYGRPVISTGQGVRGLGLEAGRHYLAAETATEFCDGVVRLARDEVLRERLVAAGRECFEQGFASQ